MDLIDRYRKYKLTHGNETDSDTDNSNDDNDNNSDSEWDIGTIREPQSPYIENAENEAVLTTNGDRDRDRGQGQGRAASPVKARVDRRQSPPPSYQAAADLPSPSSPLRENRMAAKSDLNIVRTFLLHAKVCLPSSFSKNRA